MTICNDLRQAVLQAAMQGKLTEQLPTDSSVDDLLASIVAEKVELIKQKKIKKEKPLSPISEDEIPFDVPENWKWVKLGQISSVYGGKRIPAGRKLSDKPTPFKYIRVSDMKNGTILLNDIKYVPEDIYPKIKQYTISKDDIYITVAGTIGRIGLVPEELDGANLTENADKIVTYCHFNKMFLYLLLSSEHVQIQIREATTQVGQPKLAILRIQELIIPLPPIEEQQRIVDKVEELMAKIDEMEKTEQALESIKSAFPDDMKAAILQAAMQGKLTEQLPTDSSVDDLLSSIAAEKDELIKQKKIKKGKKKDEEVEIPYDIPENWIWTKIDDLITVYGGLAYDKNNLTVKSDDMVTVFRGGNIYDMGYDFKPDDVKISSEFIKNESLFLRKNQLITPAVTSQQHLGKVALIDKDYDNVVAGGFVLNLVPFINNDIFSKFFMYAFSSPSMRLRCKEIANKSGQAFYNLSREKLLNSWIPLPPIEEQQRIVEKLDDLLLMCDELKSIC